MNVKTHPLSSVRNIAIILFVDWDVKSITATHPKGNCKNLLRQNGQLKIKVGLVLGGTCS